MKQIMERVNKRFRSLEDRFECFIRYEFQVEGEGTGRRCQDPAWKGCPRRLTPQIRRKPRPSRAEPQGDPGRVHRRQAEDAPWPG